MLKIGYGMLAGVLLATGCSGSGSEPSGFASVGITDFGNAGFSNTISTCADSSQRILDTVETGMTQGRIRELVGKPRHVKGQRWHYGAAIASPIPPDFYTISTLQFVDFLLDNVSGDFTLCQIVEDLSTEQLFVDAANSLTAIGDTTDFTNEVPTCYDAAVRIASRIEVGMTEEQVRDLVGKPVEITESGVWRYSFGFVPAPSVDFTKNLQTAAASQTVVGYSSISVNCI